MTPISGSTGGKHEPTSAFVLCLPRTGSTLLRLLLDTHPEIWAPDELKLGPLADALLETSEGLLEAPGRDWERTGSLRRSGPAADLVRETLRGLIGRGLEGRPAGRVWCEKSPQNLDHATLLAALFPEARFVVLHRHPLDTLASWLDACRFGLVFDFLHRYAPRSPHSFLEAMAEAWSDRTVRLLSFAEEHAERCRTVRYEQVVTAPEETADELFSFLGVASRPGVAAEAFRARHHQRAFRGGDINAYLASGVSRTRIGRGNDLPWRRVRSIAPDTLRCLGGLAERLGYPRIDFDRGRYSTGFEPAAAPGVEADVAGEASTAPPTGPPIERVLERALAAGAAPDRRLYLLRVDGDGGGTWRLDFRDAPPKVLAGGGSADCHIRIEARDLRSLLADEANAGVLFRSGRLTAEGELDLAGLRALLDLLQQGWRTEEGDR